MFCRYRISLTESSSLAWTYEISIQGIIFASHSALETRNYGTTEDEMLKKLACLAILSLLVGPGVASAGIVTFESTATSNAIETTANDVEGLTFNSSHYHFTDTQVSSFGGLVTPFKYMSLDAPELGSPVIVTLTGGGIFSVLSLDASQLWGDSAAAAAGNYNNADYLHLVGYISGGGVVTADLGLLAFGFNNYALSGFTNLDSMVISGFVVGGTSNASWAVDNMEFSAIPEPGTMMLLGSGLVGLVGYGRRRFKK
jgi:hypothetical protein